MHYGLLLVLLGAASGTPGPAAATRAELVSITELKLIADLPWSTPDVTDTVISLGAFAGSAQRVRVVPRLAAASPDPMALVFSDEVIAYRTNSNWSILRLGGELLDELVNAAPLANGDLVVLGRTPEVNVLARIDSSGRVVWRRTGERSKHKLDVEALVGKYAELLVSDDGAIYLPGTKLAGQVARIDADTGATPRVADLGDYRAQVWVRGDQLYRITVAGDQRQWTRHALGANDKQSTVIPPQLQEMAATPRGVLPDGGALLGQGNRLVWLAADGNSTRRLHLAGVVRAEQALFAAVRDGASVHLYRAEPGGSPTRVASVTVPDDARLVSALPSGETTFYSAQEGGILISLDAGGQITRSESIAETPEALLAVESRLDMRHPVIKADGSLLIAGVDPQGAFVIVLGIVRVDL